MLDVPLLFESGWERYCGTILVVGVSDPAIQIQRLRDRDSHLTEEDARNRVMSQGDVREKAERCLRRGPGNGVVVWNILRKRYRESCRMLEAIVRGGGVSCFG